MDVTLKKKSRKSFRELNIFTLVFMYFFQCWDFERKKEASVKLWFLKWTIYADTIFNLSTHILKHGNLLNNCIKKRTP